MCGWATPLVAELGVTEVVSMENLDQWPTRSWCLEIPATRILTGSDQGEVVNRY